MVTKSEPARARRRGFPDRREVELRAAWATDAPRPKYLVVNADEMEPGTFKDRLLLEGDPHQLIEGDDHRRLRHPGGRRLHLSARGIQAAGARGWSRPSPRRTRPATSARTSWARATAWRCTCTSAPGRYMCGEETALLNALEGKRANPRAKPPFPQSAGSGASRRSSTTSRPSANVPHIVKHGAGWFKGLSRSDGRRHQALRRQRPGEAARAVGTADGHDRCARSSKSTPAACATASASRRCCPAAPRPISSPESTSTCRWISTSVREGRQPPRHRHDDRPRRQDLPGRHGAQPGAFLRAGILRLVHALPRRAALGRADARGAWRRARASPAISSCSSCIREVAGPGQYLLRAGARAPWSRCRAR